MAVDKIRKCGLYKAYTALVGSAPLYSLIYEGFKIHELKCCHYFLLKISRYTVPEAGNKVANLVGHVQP